MPCWQDVWTSDGRLSLALTSSPHFSLCSLASFSCYYQTCNMNSALVATYIVLDIHLFTGLVVLSGCTKFSIVPHSSCGTTLARHLFVTTPAFNIYSRLF